MRRRAPASFHPAPETLRGRYRWSRCEGGIPGRVRRPGRHRAVPAKPCRCASCWRTRTLRASETCTRAAPPAVQVASATRSRPRPQGASRPRGPARACRGGDRADGVPPAASAGRRGPPRVDLGRRPARAVVPAIASTPAVRRSGPARCCPARLDLSPLPAGGRPCAASSYTAADRRPSPPRHAAGRPRRRDASIVALARAARAAACRSSVRRRLAGAASRGRARRARRASSLVVHVAGRRTRPGRRRQQRVDVRRPRRRLRAQLGDLRAVSLGRPSARPPHAGRGFARRRRLRVGRLGGARSPAPGPPPRAREPRRCRVGGRRVDALSTSGASRPRSRCADGVPPRRRRRRCAPTRPRW